MTKVIYRSGRLNGKPRHEVIHEQQVAHARANLKGLEGTRMREVKHMKGTSAEGRIARLVQLAHEFGPQKLEEEIAVHQRKIDELRAALAQVTGE